LGLTMENGRGASLEHATIRQEVSNVMS
jgi:hypothetical protein